MSSIKSKVDNNNEVKNLNRSFNDTQNASVNKWKSFQSNIFHDKNKKSVEIKSENTHPITSTKPSKLNSMKNFEEASCVEI